MTSDEDEAELTPLEESDNEGVTDLEDVSLIIMVRYFADLLTIPLFAV